MADGVRFVDHSAVVKARIEQAIHRRLEAAGIVVANRAKESLSAAFPPASSPGEPPAKRTGRLRASVATERVGMTERVGTNVFYGKILEQGGHTIAARPWLRPALLHSQPRIQAILGAPIV